VKSIDRTIGLRGVIGFAFPVVIALVVQVARTDLTGIAQLDLSPAKHAKYAKMTVLQDLVLMLRFDQSRP